MRSALERAAPRFIESGQREAWIRIEPTAEQARACRSRGLSAESIEVRLIRVDLPNEVELLMTSLRDADRYGAEHFGALYHQRGALSRVRSLTDNVISQPGIRHGELYTVPAETRQQTHEHGDEDTPHQHEHLTPIA